MSYFHSLCGAFGGRGLLVGIELAVVKLKSLFGAHFLVGWLQLGPPLSVFWDLHNFRP